MALINGTSIDENPYNESTRAWIGRNRPTPDPTLTALARKAVERVSREPSELVELWAGAGADGWRAALADQLSRLA